VFTSSHWTRRSTPHGRLECIDARRVALGLPLGVEEGVERGEGPRNLEEASGS
jgi:hypothetical protein